GTVGQFLTTEPQSQRLCIRKRKADIEECLVQVELIFVWRARSAVAAILEAALKLGEEAEILSEPGVRVNHVALQQVAIVILRPEAPLAVVKVFVALANLAAEGQIEVAATVERYEFDGV